MISGKNRASVKVLLCDNDPYMRQGLRNALVNEGYKDVRAVGRLSMVRDIIAATLVDLLILDVEAPDGDAIALVADIRNSRLGRNPFLPIVFVTWDTVPSTISRAAGSGADFILMKPLSPAQLFARIESLVSERKPFVATPGYIGPERREKERWGDTRHFEVPNTLRDKLDGKAIDPAAISDMIDLIVHEMNDSRLKLAAFKLAAIVDAASGVYEKKATLAGLENAFATMAVTAREIGSLGAGDLAKLCASLIRIARTVLQDPAAVDAKQIELLRPLSQSILLAANPNLRESDATEEISKAVSRFAPKKHTADAEGALPL
jgi:DNA-binding response OmpR family regulator